MRPHIGKKPVRVRLICAQGSAVHPEWHCSQNRRSKTVLFRYCLPRRKSSCFTVITDGRRDGNNTEGSATNYVTFDPSFAHTFGNARAFLDFLPFCVIFSSSYQVSHRTQRARLMLTRYMRRLYVFKHRMHVTCTFNLRRLHRFSYTDWIQHRNLWAGNK